MNQVVLVGAGCGKSTITLEAARLLSRCDCVVYDSLLDDGLLELCPRDCKKIFVGKRAGHHSAKQEEINRILVDCGKEYPLTVRLKGGDPFVFGRGGEELLALEENGIQGYAVPGISSCIAAAELAGIPITHRGLTQGFQVHTAHTANKEINFTNLGASDDTLVFLMAKQAAGKIQRDLLSGGMDPAMPVAVLSQAGSKDFTVKRGTLSELEALAGQLPAPLTVVVGKVCALALGKPAVHRSSSDAAMVAVTGTPSHVRRVSDALLKRGLLPLDWGYSRIQPLDFDRFFQQMDDFAWLVFTSGNGVEYFFRRVRELRLDLRRFGSKKFAVIGRHTADRLEQYGFTADLMPEEYTAKALCRRLLDLRLPKEQIALLRAKAGSPVLLQAGTQFDVYETVTEQDRLASVAAKLSQSLPPVQAITFGSAGGARALLEVCRLPEGVLPVCIGEETAQVVREYGYQPKVASEATAEELANIAALALEEKTWND